jgi:hypothetical protein
MISTNTALRTPSGCRRLTKSSTPRWAATFSAFVDYYSGYHQISIKQEDQEKTVFITPFGAYCYMTMSFGLKNAGATYQ